MKNSTGQDLTIGAIVLAICLAIATTTAICALGMVYASWVVGVLVILIMAVLFLAKSPTSPLNKSYEVLS